VARALVDSSSALATRRIGMCGYTAVPEDGRTYFFFLRSDIVTHAYGSRMGRVFRIVYVSVRLYVCFSSTQCLKK